MLASGAPGSKKRPTASKTPLWQCSFLEALGVPNPTSYYSLALYPEFVESFHQWHRRMGMETFPEAGFCC